jgi:hypothetical protein
MGLQVTGHLMMYQRDCETNTVRFGQAATHRRGHGHSLTTSQLEYRQGRPLSDPLHLIPFRHIHHRSRLLLPLLLPHPLPQPRKVKTRLIYWRARGDVDGIRTGQSTEVVRAEWRQNKSMLVKKKGKRRRGS